MRSIIIVAGLILGVAGAFGKLVQQPAQPVPTKPPAAASATAGAPAAAGPRSVSIGRDHRGHFQAHGRVDGRQVSFMVDTGASVIALTERDADRYPPVAK